MTTIDTLIAIKKQSNTDDIIRFLDELITYEKLSKLPAFQDLEHSEAAKKKLPLLSAVYQNEFYALAIAEMAESILAYLEEDIPPVLHDRLQALTPKQVHKLNIMMKGVLEVSYHPLEEYVPDIMAEDVIAVFESERPNEETEENALLILVKPEQSRIYSIYQGHYNPGAKERKSPAFDKIKPYVHTESDGSTLTISHYSLLGNNGYVFAIYTKAGTDYQVLMPYHDTIWLLNSGICEQVVKLDLTQCNELALAKTKVAEFAATIAKFIREGREADAALEESSGRSNSGD